MSNLLKIILMIIIAYFLLGCSCSCSTKENFAKKRGGKGASKGASRGASIVASKGAGKGASRGASKGVSRGASKGVSSGSDKKLLTCDELEDYLFITTKEERGFEDKGKAPKNLQIRKWSKWIKIKIHDFDKVKVTQKDLINELKKIKDEINELSFSNKVYLLDFPNDLPDALKNEKENYTLYLNSDKEIVAAVPSLKNNVYDENGKIKNQGLFDLTIGGNNIITNARVWVNTTNKNKKCMKHILREEVIQSFGMSNDLDFEKGDTSPKTKTIFNQEGGICEHKFNDFDKKVIKTHLSKDVKANDTRMTVHRKLKPDGCVLPENKNKPPSAGAQILANETLLRKECSKMGNQGTLCAKYRK
jgi:hypothetical protein